MLSILRIIQNSYTLSVCKMVSLFYTKTCGTVNGTRLRQERTSYELVVTYFKNSPGETQEIYEQHKAGKSKLGRSSSRAPPQYRATTSFWSVPKRATCSLVAPSLLIANLTLAHTLVLLNRFTGKRKNCSRPRLK